MSYAQVLKTDVEVTDLTLPIFNPNDGWLTPSTLMLVDFRRPKCYPSQLATPPNGTPFVNLANSNNGIFVTSASGITFSGGKITMTGTANNTLNYGATGYDLPAMGSPDFLITMWIRVHADKSTINLQGLFQKGTTTVNNTGFTFVATYNAALNSVRMTISNGTVAISAADVAFTENDTWVQFGFAFESNKVKVYKNGVLAGESATTMTKPYNAHANPIKSFGTDAWNQFKGDMVRVGLTKLDEGKTAAERVADDWNANKLAILALV